MTPTLLNTRPLAQAPALTQSVEATGYAVVECPLIVIEGVPLDLEAVSQLAEADKLVFVSRNAVVQLDHAWRALMGRPLAPVRDLKPGAQCFAIGAATQSCLQSLGWPTAKLAHDDFVSEALLARDDWQDLSGERVLLVKGEGGRQALHQGLQAAGADVTSWAVYRRALPEMSQTQWQHCWQYWAHASHPVALITSWQSFEHLRVLIQRWGHENDQAWLFAQRVIVLSDRLAKALAQAGWQGPIYLAQPQSQVGIIAALRRLSVSV